MASTTVHSSVPVRSKQFRVHS